MPEFDSFGKTLIYIGIFLVVVGLVIHFGGKLFNLGRLPGDIHIQREGFSFSFPIVTCILISIILTVLLNFFGRR